MRRRIIAEAKAYGPVRPTGSFLCGRSAALIFGAPVAHPGPLEVATLAPKRAPHGTGVVGRKIAPHLVEVRRYGSVLMSSPATTWAMLARDLPLRELVRIGDWMVHVPRDESGHAQPSRALATLDDLTSAVNAGPRPPGTLVLREALSLVRVGSASPLETDYRVEAAMHGLPEPRLDAEIRDGFGRLLGISEIYYPQFGVVVEIEGDHHRTSRSQWRRDIAKYRDYEHIGIHVVRLTSPELRGPSPSGIHVVAQALRARGWSS